VPASADYQPIQPDLVLVNPCAGAGRGARQLKRLKQFARQQHWDAEFVPTGSAEDLSVCARAAALSGRTRLFVLGGDGTFQLAINAILTASPVVLGLIPAGGGNDLVAALGLPADAVAAAKLLLHAEPFPLDVVRVRTSDGVVRLYVGGGGLGLDAEASRLANEAYRRVPGRLRYLLSAIHALAGHRAAEVRVHFERDEAPAVFPQTLLVSVLNTASFGAGVRLAPNARIDDGQLDLVVLEDLSFWQVLQLLPMLLLNGDVHTKRIQRRRVRWVRIETAHPCAFHGDGEIFGMTPVEIEVVPQAIRVLRPSRAIF
jgi:diacylglycerol kinase (ATP)